LELDKHLHFCQMIIWDKGPMGMGWRYRRSYETVLVAYKGSKMKWYADSKDIENIIRPGDGIRKIIPSQHQHPTEKPIELAAHFIKLHTREGDTVLDPFCGSGSTGEAALQMDRNFIGIELNSEYVEMSNRRLANAMPLFAGK
jgi:site-specific DNA-methyltransferase (adenine-specific)